MSWYAKQTGSYAFGSVEANGNAQEIHDVLINAGYSLESICALLGNSAGEGGLNPWRWQSDDVPTYSQYQNWTSAQASLHGYGMFGFTPASRYIESSTAQSYSGYGPHFSDVTGNPADGNAQLLFLLDELPSAWTHGLYNYYVTAFQNIGVDINDFYYMSYSDFVTGTGYSIAELTGAFELCYEKPDANGAAVTYNFRVEQAEAWYEYFSGQPPVPPTPTPTYGRELPIWYYLRLL